MAEFYSGTTRNLRIAYVAVGTDGRTYTITGQYAPQESFFDKVYRAIGAVAALPNIFYMGKVHGVKHKARQEKWTERNPKHNGKDKGKKGKK